MTEAKFLTVNIEVQGDSENTPEEALHHALASLHDRGLIISWSEPLEPVAYCSKKMLGNVHEKPNLYHYLAVNADAGRGNTLALYALHPPQAAI